MRKYLRILPDDAQVRKGVEEEGMLTLYLVMSYAGGSCFPHSLHLLKRDADGKARAISGIDDDGVVHKGIVVPVTLSCDMRELEKMMKDRSEAICAEC